MSSKQRNLKLSTPAASKQTLVKLVGTYIQKTSSVLQDAILDHIAHQQRLMRSNAGHRDESAIWIHRQCLPVGFGAKFDWNKKKLDPAIPSNIIKFSKI
jgi:hypothetical protein